ncbi:MAG: response regulator [Desulfobulbaceae bacterium]|nr:response regulator [Desulfobulbaceae bacterium]
MTEIRQHELATLQKTVKFFEALLAASRDGILITNDAATILLANQSFCSIIGCSPGDVIETSLFDWLNVFEEDPVSSWLNLLKEAGGIGAWKNIEFQLMTGARPQFFSVNASSLALESSEEQGVSISIWRDITSRKKAETALEEANVRLEQRIVERTEELRLERDNFANLLKAMEDGVCIITQQHDIQFVNYALEKDFGPWQGRKCYEYFHNRQEPCSWCKHDQVFAGETVHWTWYSEKNDKTFDLIDTPMTSQNGSTWQLKISRDVTERIKSAQEKKQITNKLIKAQKMEVVGLMAGGVAHDLNNILSGIVGYPELILMNLPGDSELRKPIEAIHESGQRAAAVVADLLTVARGAASTREVHNLNSLILEYLNSPECAKLKSQHQNVIFRHQLEATQPNILCSTVHIKKCFMTLVTNAAEAIGGDGTVVVATSNQHIDVAASVDRNIEQGNYVVLDIRDTGPGISHTDLEHIFEPFYSKKIMGRSGTGLGLTVVWNTIKDHSGRIFVESDEQGTCFQLCFPISEQEVIDHIENDKTAKLTSSNEHILVVDDEPQLRDIASQILQTIGYKVDSVCSGELAIKFVKDTPVDLIVIDMLMEPGINGYQTYKEILKLYPGQNAIIASGFSESDDVKAALKLGVGKFIKKPYSMDQLGRAVREVLDN